MRTISTSETAGKTGQKAPNYAPIDAVLQQFQYQQDALIEVLHIAQEEFEYLKPELLSYIAGQLKLPLSWVYGVASFYHYFALNPPGEHTCIVCTGTSCYIKQAAEILELLQTEFGVQPGQTTPDGKLTLATVLCPGSCGMAPVLVVDGEMRGHETPTSTLQHIQALLANEQSAHKEQHPSDTTQSRS